MTDFRNRLIEAMEYRNMSQADLSKATGLSKPRISQYVNGVYEAKQDALYRIAEALHVNVAWLMGYDVDMKGANLLTADLALFGEKNKLMDYYDKLNEEGRAKVLEYAADLSENDRYKKRDSVSEDAI